MSIACIVLGMLIAFLYGISCFFFFIFRFDEEFGGFFLKRNRKEFFLFFKFSIKVPKDRKTSSIQRRSKQSADLFLSCQWLPIDTSNSSSVHPNPVHIDFVVKRSRKILLNFFFFWHRVDFTSLRWLIYPQGVGVVCPQVGVIYPQVGVVYPQVGVVYPQVEVINPQVGVVYPQVEVIYPQVGEVYPQVGVIYPQIGKHCFR